MGDLQLEIEIAQGTVLRAGAYLQTVTRQRRQAIKAGLPDQELNVLVEAAEQRLNAAEVRLRALYEGKGDWVPLSHTGSMAADPAPIAFG